MAVEVISRKKFRKVVAVTRWIELGFAMTRLSCLAISVRFLVEVAPLSLGSHMLMSRQLFSVATVCLVSRFQPLVTLPSLPITRAYLLPYLTGMTKVVSSAQQAPTVLCSSRPPDTAFKRYH